MCMSGSSRKARGCSRMPPDSSMKNEVPCSISRKARAAGGLVARGVRPRPGAKVTVTVPAVRVPVDR